MASHMPRKMVSESDAARGSVLTVPHLERRREDRELRRILGTQSLHPGQLALMERGGGGYRGGSTLRLALTMARDVYTSPLPLERKPDPSPVVDSSPTPSCTPARVETRAKPWSGDAVAQAQTLRDAARDGVAFCAVCEAARRRAGAAR